MATANTTVERVFDRLSMMRDGKFDLKWIYNETLQEFFDEAAVDTQFVANGG